MKKSLDFIRPTEASKEFAKAEKLRDTINNHTENYNFAYTNV